MGSHLTATGRHLPYGDHIHTVLSATRHIYKVRDRDWDWDGK